MNDLQTLHAALSQDEPSQDVVDRSRHRLQNRIMGGPASRKRTGWLTVGTGLTVAAAAAAVAIAAVPGAPVEGPSEGTDTGTQAKVLTGQEVLLAAATAAEKAPESSGTYWYVKITMLDDPTNVVESWVKADGQNWVRDRKTQGKVVQMPAGPLPPFSLAGTSMTLDQLLDLPTDPDALKAAIANAIENGDARYSGGLIKDHPEFLAMTKFDSLIALVSGLPAPPAVRAAAFRAIAAEPGVTSLGTVPGGEGLLLPGGKRLVVNPATGQVTVTSSFVPTGRANYPVFGGGAKVTTKWTNTLPS